MPVRRTQLVDPTQNDEVVASVVFGPDVAVKPHQGVFDDGVACLGGSPGYAGPLVGAFPGELVRNGVLEVGEDVHGELPGLAYARIGGGGFHDAERDQRRFRGDTEEGLAGEPDRSRFIDAADDGDSGGVVSESVTERPGIDGLLVECCVHDWFTKLSGCGWIGYRSGQRPAARRQ